MAKKGKNAKMEVYYARSRPGRALSTRSMIPDVSRWIGPTKFSPDGRKRMIQRAKSTHHARNRHPEARTLPATEMPPRSRNRIICLVFRRVIHQNQCDISSNIFKSSELHA
jgi:hypothetical protein